MLELNYTNANGETITLDADCELEQWQEFVNSGAEFDDISDKYLASTLRSVREYTEEFVELMQACDDNCIDELEYFLALVDHEFNPEYTKSSLENGAYYGVWDSALDWAEQFLDDTGMLSEMPENLKYYFDYEKWLRDAEQDFDFIELESGGVLVWNRNC